MDKPDLNKTLLVITRELLWLVLTGLAVIAILYPITRKIDYLFIPMNTVFIALTLTYFRWTVTFRSLPFFRPGLIRFLLFAINLSLFIFVMQKEEKYLSLWENFYVEDFGFPKILIDEDSKAALFKYLYTEIVFFGTGSLAMIVAFNLRLIVAWWQYYKYKASALLDD